MYQFETGCPDCGGVMQHADCCDYHNTGLLFDGEGAVVDQERTRPWSAYPEFAECFDGRGIHVGIDSAAPGVESYSTERVVEAVNRMVAALAPTPQVPSSPVLNRRGRRRLKRQGVR
jgi:hypothetical protein